MHGLLVAITTKWHLMSGSEQIYAGWNAVADAAIAVLLMLMVWVGLTKDANAFAIWVPLLGLVLFLRFKQARRRWQL